MFISYLRISFTIFCFSSFFYLLLSFSTSSFSFLPLYPFSSLFHVSLFSSLSIPSPPSFIYFPLNYIQFLFPSTFSYQFSNFLPFLLLYVLSSLHTLVFCFLSPPNPTTSLFPFLDLPLFLSFPSFPLFIFHFLSYSPFNLTFLSFPSSPLSSLPLLISFIPTSFCLYLPLTFAFFFLPILLFSFLVHHLLWHASHSSSMHTSPFFSFFLFFVSIISFLWPYSAPLPLLCSIAFSYPFLLPNLPWHIFLSLFLLPFSFYLTSIISFLISFLLITSPPSHFLPHNFFSILCFLSLAISVISLLYGS